MRSPIVALLLFGAAVLARGDRYSCAEFLGVWPLPRNCSLDIDSPSLVLASDFKFILSKDSKLPEGDVEVLQKAFSRYEHILKTRRNFKRSASDVTVEMQQLVVFTTPSSAKAVSRDGKLWPTLDDGEGYRLDIVGKEGTLTGTTGVWGVLHGLETFSQIFDLNNETSPYSLLTIVDAPRFRHRGLMLDTGRHFLPLTSFQAVLDGMSYNKYNVLHWHITDDESFPIESTSFPNLANQGSFGADGRHVYSTEDVASIIEFARVRGIRVIPEFDMPGHSTSWFNGYPDLRTDCPDSSLKDFSKPMDPTKNGTYAFLDKLLTEMSGRFQDDFFHIGGDEVDGSCWEGSKKVESFCKEHNISSSPALQMYFEKKIVSQLEGLGKTPVIWEENFGSLTGYPSNAVVEVWKHRWGNTTVLDSLIRKGYRTIYTTPDWYLDYSTNAIDGGYTRRIDDASEWKYYYQVDPFTNSTLNAAEEATLLGGEICSWDVLFDGTNLLSNIFPRAIAVAERLWSDKSVRNLDSAANRILPQRCRMVARGIPAAPIAMADHCPFPFEFEYSSPGV